MNEHSWRELVGEERSVGFDQVAIGVASSDTMRSWSKGEVKNPEGPERGVPGYLLGIAVNISGLGDRTALAKSEWFRPSLPEEPAMP